MRILFWNQLFLPSIGGVEILTSRLAARLIARGHEVAVVATRLPRSLPASEVIGGVPVHRFRFNEALAPDGGDPGAKLDLLADIVNDVSSLKRQFRPDVVHINLSDANPYFHLRSHKAHPCPSILVFQTAIGPQFAGNRVLGKLIQSAAQTVVPSNAAAVSVARATGTPIGSIRVIAPGVPAAALQARPNVPESSIPMFVFVGRIYDYKGADTAIEAIARLDGAARLQIIGGGPQRQSLEQSVQARGLDHLVRFEGLVDDDRKSQILAESFAMVVPSRHEELFGMVAVEAALAGLPVIASRIGGLTEIVVDGETGLLVPPGDPAELADAMARLIKDRALACRMGLAGRQRALANYTLERTVDEFEQLYAECARA
jgi:glycogen synthase